jgi:glycosyltransferase involved in cell wall biosynthesis
MKKSPLHPNLTIVIPAYNEAEHLPTLLSALLPVSLEKGWEIVIVNDGSRDGTGDVLNEAARQFPTLKALHHKVQKGYGGALKTGLRAASAPYAITFDADGQHQIEDIERVFQFAVQNEADMVVGKRPENIQEDPWRKIGKRLIRTFANFLLPMPVTDLNSGFKLYRTDLVKKYLRICPDTMAFSDVITMAFVSKKHKVMEHPIQIRPRQAGKSTINLNTAIDTVIQILHIIMLFNPMRIFLPVSVFLAGLGTLWAIPFLLMGRGLSSMAMLLILLGVLFFSNGLIATQLSAIRLESLDDE